MTDPCICGHEADEHSTGLAGCLGVTDANGELFCTCWEYDPGPEF